MNEVDPPLSKLGYAQSIITGQYLQAYFECELKPTKVVITSSPFIKCIMTACAIASQIHEKFGAPQVVIDGFHAEVLTTKMFEQDPISELEIYQCKSEKDFIDLKRKYKIDPKIKLCVDRYTQNEISSVYPESSEDALVRLTKQWSKIKNKYRDGAAVINISHKLQVSWASAIESIICKDKPIKEQLQNTIEAVMASEEEGNKVPQETSKALKNLVNPKVYLVGAYCALTGVLYTKSENNLMFYCQGSHLKTQFAVE